MTEMQFLVYNDISLAADFRAGSVNAFISLLQWLATQGRVTILHTHYRRPTRVLPANVEVIWRPDFFNLLARNVRAKLGRSRPFLVYKDSWFKRHHFTRLVHRQKWDALFIEYLDSSFLLERCNVPPSTKLIGDLFDLMSSRGESFRRLGISTRENLEIDLASELEAIRRFDKVICLQAVEAKIINSKLGQERALVTRRNPGVPIDAAFSAPLARRLRDPLKIGFMGTTADFNVDAVRQLLGPFYTLMDVDYQIAGSVCEIIKDTETTPNVHLLGQIESVARFYADIDVAANLIRFGSGLKTKNVEALLFGVPVITTAVGAQGLEDFVQRGLYIVDDMPGWKKAVSEVARIEDSVRYRIELQARARAAFDPEVVFRSLKAYLTTA